MPEERNELEEKEDVDEEIEEIIEEGYEEKEKKPKGKKRKIIRKRKLKEKEEKEETPEDILTSIQADKLKKAKEILQATAQLPVRIYRRGLDGKSRYCETIFLSSVNELMSIEDYLVERGGGGWYDLYLQTPKGGIIKLRDISIEGKQKPYQKSREFYEDKDIGGEAMSEKETRHLEEKINLRVENALKEMRFDFERKIDRILDLIERTAKKPSEDNEIQRRLDKLEAILSAHSTQQSTIDIANLTKTITDTLIQIQNRPQNDPYQSAMINIMNTLLSHVIEKTAKQENWDISKVKDTIEAIKSMQDMFTIREPSRWESLLDAGERIAELLMTLQQQAPQTQQKMLIEQKKRGRKPKLKIDNPEILINEVEKMKQEIKEKKKPPSTIAHSLKQIHYLTSQAAPSNIEELNLIRSGRKGIKKFLEAILDDEEYISEIMKFL